MIDSLLLHFIDKNTKIRQLVCNCKSVHKIVHKRTLLGKQKDQKVPLNGKKWLFYFWHKKCNSSVELTLTAMKRMNAIQYQNLSFVKFFIIALLFVFLVKMGSSIFVSKQNEISRNTPLPPQASGIKTWRG